jgi:GNAT superfamily N-acetyltransferase
MLAFTTREDTEVDKATVRNGLRAVTEAVSGLRVRQMGDADLDRILELRSVVRWSADPSAFDLLRGVCGARWAVAETPDGALAGMVGAVPLGDIGILCHLAVHDGHRGLGLSVLLSSWAVAYLRSRGAKAVRLYSTGKAEGLYRSLGFREVTPRTVHRLEGGADAPRARAGRRSQGRDAHVRGPTRAIRRRPLELRGRSFGPAPRHPQPASWTGARRPRRDGQDERIPDPKLPGPRNPHRPLSGIRPERSTPPARQHPLGDRRRTHPSHRPGSSRVSRPLSPARVRLRGHAGPDADGAGRDEGGLPGWARSLRHDAVSANLAVSFWLTREVRLARKRRFEKGLVMWNCANGNRFWHAEWRRSSFLLTANG